jgi:hypothetical protein
VFLLFFWNCATAKTLCLSEEKVVMSFQINKSKKWLSVCKGRDASYLVYRYGTNRKLEFSFPRILDDSSWRKFEFSGARRLGGKENAGFGDFSLSFSSGANEYSVFQQWSDEDDSYHIGINIGANKRSISLPGNRNTQEGSLVLLEFESARIPNVNAQ